MGSGGGNSIRFGCHCDLENTTFIYSLGLIIQPIHILMHQIVDFFAAWIYISLFFSTNKSMSSNLSSSNKLFKDTISDMPFWPKRVYIYIYIYTII